MGALAGDALRRSRMFGLLDDTVGGGLGGLEEGVRDGVVWSRLGLCFEEEQCGGWLSGWAAKENEQAQQGTRLDLLLGIEPTPPPPLPHPPCRLQMRTQLASVARPVRLLAGHHLFEEGDEANSFYILQEGEEGQRRCSCEEGEEGERCLWAVIAA